MIKPLFDVSFIKDPFWRGFAEVWTHMLWVIPLSLLCLIIGSIY